jgi:hypothetical protein
MAHEIQYPEKYSGIDFEELVKKAGWGDYYEKVLSDHGLKRLEALVNQAESQGELYSLLRELQGIQNKQKPGYGKEVEQLIKQKMQLLPV